MLALRFDDRKRMDDVDTVTVWNVVKAWIAGHSGLRAVITGKLGFSKGSTKTKPEHPLRPDRWPVSGRPSIHGTSDWG
jgi:hypothetical protein